ncbi:hypothetical protein [Microvirga aerophila]|uniref:Uncharacterized protein n=1 Tax=Microvirga aerophila TaxID=670291 RepID=A0A512BZM0_9HYPH|nr:hypothetical protein [Microvirga aerophila]GEO17402.1 hypothetical protein MAE02_50980 [Microvirga aerophila]
MSFHPTSRPPLGLSDKPGPDGFVPPPHWERSRAEFDAYNVGVAYSPDLPAAPAWWFGTAHEFWDRRYCLAYEAPPPGDCPIEQAIGWYVSHTLFMLPVHTTHQANPFLQSPAVHQPAGATHVSTNGDTGVPAIVDDPPHTRDDYDDIEDYAQYLRQSGFDLRDEHGKPVWVSIHGTGEQARLHRAINGDGKRQYQRTWEGYGQTQHLAGRDFTKLYNAVAFANCQGWVLNTFISISWSTVGITTDLLVEQAHRRFNERMRKWLLERGLPLAWVWVLERGNTYGLHSHIHVAVPKQHRRDFMQWAKKCVSHIPGRPLVNTEISKTVRFDCRSDRDVAGQWWRFPYYAKGVDPAVGFRDADDKHIWRLLNEVAGLTLKPQGLVKTKRAGVSRALDAKARRAFDAQYGLPPFALANGGKEPADLYTDEYLKWHDAQCILGTLNI